MIEFIDIPTEQTTAITNVVLAILAMICIFQIHQTKDQRNHKSQKKNIWSWVFKLIALAGVLGAIVHGFMLSEEAKYILWQILYLILGLVVSLFVVGVIHDLKGYINSKIILAIIAAGTLFFITASILDNFLAFIVYEILAIVFSISVYIWLATSRRLVGSWLMVGGLFISMVAAIIQSIGAVQITFIWKFDQNGIFHIMQAIGLLFIMAGVKSSLRQPLV